MHVCVAGRGHHHVPVTHADADKAGELVTPKQIKLVNAAAMARAPKASSCGSGSMASPLWSTHPAST